ncbi:hypothetical protein Glove_456g22 [Diversispora epigaea]|uniref:Methyltransferase type 12 domain-containing protein n=1 Tax=Diversispora epigaea TaxID=1348612 RepID=A0A397GTM3_9GLOM|nr:hypothetical protein Glove_456g22 [Diversispora epigaea]
MSSSSQINEIPDNNLINGNKQYFESIASTYDANPVCVTIAQKCTKALLNEAEFDPEKSEVLDFACGTGLISQEICAHVKTILGVDATKGMVDLYNKKVWQQGIDKEEMQAICLELKESEGDQLNGRKFDFVVCASSYHHLEDINSTTKVLANYLKPGGQLFVFDLKHDPKLAHKFFGQLSEHNHEHDHNIDNIISHKGGFNPTELEHALKSTELLEDINIDVAFEYHKWDEKDKCEYVFEFLRVKGRRKY